MTRTVPLLGAFCYYGNYICALLFTEQSSLLCLLLGYKLWFWYDGIVYTDPNSTPSWFPHILENLEV